MEIYIIQVLTIVNFQVMRNKLRVFTSIDDANEMFAHEREKYADYCLDNCWDIETDTHAEFTAGEQDNWGENAVYIYLRTETLGDII